MGSTYMLCYSEPINQQTSRVKENDYFQVGYGSIVQQEVG